jgi:ketosteroid isomerase-like protein
MSARDEIKTLMEAAVASFNKGDPTAFVNLVDDDLEVFDHAPFRFDSKADFLAWFQPQLAGAETSTDRWNQPSYRAYNDDLGIVNTYDIFTSTHKDGRPPTVQNNRSTYVFAKRSGHWKIVSAHFSYLIQH